MKTSHLSVSFLKATRRETEQARSGPTVEFRAELGLEPSPLTPSGVLVSATPAASSPVLLGRPGKSLDRRPQQSDHRAWQIQLRLFWPPPIKLSSDL